MSTQDNNDVIATIQKIVHHYNEIPNQIRAVSQISARAATLALRQLELISELNPEQRSAYLQKSHLLLLQIEKNPIFRPRTASNISSTPIESPQQIDQWDEEEENSSTLTSSSKEIQNLKTSLAGAASSIGYKAALSRLPTSCSFCAIAIPSTASTASTTSTASISSTSRQRQKENDLLAQDQKDLQRDTIEINGLLHDGSIEPYTIILQHIVNICNQEKSRNCQLSISKETTPSPSASSLSSFATMIIRFANRTCSGGDSFDVIHEMIQNQNYSIVMPSSTHVQKPLKVTITVGPYYVKNNEKRNNSDTSDISDTSNDVIENGTWYYGLRAVVQASLVYTVCDTQDPTVVWSVIEGKYEKILTKRINVYGVVADGDDAKEMESCRVELIKLK